MNTPVNFKLAKLLKEKGYNEPCYNYYISEYNGHFKKYNGQLRINNILDDIGDVCGEKRRTNLKGQPHITIAPTIAEVVMWLYEKYKIWINVSGDCDYKFRFEIHTWNWYENEKSHRLSHIVLGESFWDTSSKPFTSPTEAYEKGIEYVLKNLI